jgi:hypothetical protein
MCSFHSVWPSYYCSVRSRSFRMASALVRNFHFNGNEKWTMWNEAVDYKQSCNLRNNHFYKLTITNTAIVQNLERIFNIFSVVRMCYWKLCLEMGHYILQLLFYCPFLDSLYWSIYVLTNSTIKGKYKVIPVLFLTEHHAMKAYWGSGGIAPCIFDVGTRWS